jgi:hypothetical protein
VSRICEEFSQLAKGKVVRGSIRGRVICERHSGPLTLHYTEREVCAVRLPASRRALLSNTRATQPSGRATLATPRLERAGPPHMPVQAHARRPKFSPSFSRSGHRRPLPHPDGSVGSGCGLYTIWWSSMQG